MNLGNLTNKNLIILNSKSKTKDQVIRELVEALNKEGILESKEDFLKAVLEREKISPTGLEEGLAIPHGKSTAVKRTSFAVARLVSPLDEWESIDEDNRVTLVFLIAIPKAEEGSTHIEVLTKLTTAFLREGFIKSLQEAKSEEELLNVISESQEEVEVHSESKVDSTGKTIIAITACATGIAHTYLAAEALEKAGRKMGVQISTEKQGANGIEDEHTKEAIDRADGLIIATDVSPKNLGRFQGKPFINVRVAEPLKKSEELINRVLENPDGVIESSLDNGEPKNNRGQKEGAFSILKGHFLTGISYMIPLVIAGAVIMGIARVGGSVFGVTDIWDGSHSESLNVLVRLFHTMDGIGGKALGLMLPFIAGFIAFSISDKPGIVPGFVGGVLANELGTGFVGSLVAGLLAGYTVKLIMQKIKLPGFASGITAIFIAPVFGTLISALILVYIISTPLAAMNLGLESWLMGMSGGNQVLLAAIIGGMVGFDLGGPVNKAAVTTSMALLGSGITTPNTAAQVAIIVPPIGLGIATLIGKEKYNPALQEAGKSSLLMGLVGISEGAIPFAIESPLKVIPITVIGSSIASAMAVMLGANNPAPISGFYGWFTVEQWPIYVASIAVGSLFIGISSVVLRKIEA